MAWSKGISMRVAGAVGFAVVGLAVAACGSDDSGAEGTAAAQMSTTT